MVNDIMYGASIITIRRIKTILLCGFDCKEKYGIRDSTKQNYRREARR